MKSKINSIIEQGKGLRVEFKSCTNRQGSDVFKTVCAFHNRSGGELLSGVNDEGSITGISREKAAQTRENFAGLVNNPQKGRLFYK